MDFENFSLPEQLQKEKHTNKKISPYSIKKNEKQYRSTYDLSAFSDINIKKPLINILLINRNLYWLKNIKRYVKIIIVNMQRYATNASFFIFYWNIQ